MSGQAQLNGVAIHNNTQLIHNQVTYLPESVNLYVHLSAIENLEYFLALSGTSRSVNEINQALDRVDLTSQFRAKKLSSYSKGMRQKVAIALALLRKTPILFLDEPTSGLDPIAIDEFHRIVSALTLENTTIFMVTHDVYGACQVANRIGLLRNGRLVDLFDAPENEKIAAETVHKAFAKVSAQ